MQQQLAALEAQRAALEQRHKELAEAQQREEARRQELEAARAAGDQASDAQKLLLLQEQVRMLESRVGSVGSGLDHLAGQQHSMFEATRLAPLEVWRPLPAYTPQEGSAGDEARLILEQCRVDAAPRKEDYDKLRATCPPCPELDAVVSRDALLAPYPPLLPIPTIENAVPRTRILLGEFESLRLRVERLQAEAARTPSPDLSRRIAAASSRSARTKLNPSDWRRISRRASFRPGS